MAQKFKEQLTQIKDHGEKEKSEKYFQGELIGLMVSAHADEQSSDNEGDTSASRWDN